MEAVSAIKASVSRRRITVSKPHAGLSPAHVTLVLIGNSFAGKTALLTQFTKGLFPVQIPQTSYDSGITWIPLDGRIVELVLYDASGLEREDLIRLRESAYSVADIVLICFAIDSPDSFENISYEHSEWMSEVSRYCRWFPYFLVGTKVDLRNDTATKTKLRKTSQHPITRAEGEECKSKINALQYFECSARTGEGIADLFEAAARVASSKKGLKQPQKKRRGVFGPLRSEK